MFSSKQKLRRKLHMFVNLRTANHFKYFKLIQLHLLKLASSAQGLREHWEHFKTGTAANLPLLPHAGLSKTHFAAILLFSVSPYSCSLFTVLFKFLPRSTVALSFPYFADISGPALSVQQVKDLFICIPAALEGAEGRTSPHSTGKFRYSMCRFFPLSGPSVSQHFRSVWLLIQAENEMFPQGLVPPCICHLSLVFRLKLKKRNRIVKILYVFIL